MKPGDLMHWIIGPSPDKEFYREVPFEGQVRSELIDGPGRNKRTYYLGKDEDGSDWYSGPFPHIFFCVFVPGGNSTHLVHVQHVPQHILAVYEQYKASVE